MKILLKTEAELLALGVGPRFAYTFGGKTWPCLFDGGAKVFNIQGAPPWYAVNPVFVDVLICDVGDPYLNPPSHVDAVDKAVDSSGLWFKHPDSRRVGCGAILPHGASGLVNHGHHGAACSRPRYGEYCKDIRSGECDCEDVRSRKPTHTCNEGQTPLMGWWICRVCGVNMRKL